MGATVIKVENPSTGDGNRDAFDVGGIGLMHLALNAGARSLAVDRRSPDWPRIVAACAAWADAVVVGTRPSDARRRGMDFLTMREANPGIVYCSVSGYGDEGPWRDQTAHGQTIDAFAGLVPVVPGDVQPQTRAGWRTAGTTLGGVFAAVGILNALYRRARGAAHAQYLSVSLWQAAMWWSWRDLTSIANTGEPWVDYGDLGSRYGLYTTADDRTLLVAPVEQRFWTAFCELAGLPDEVAARGDWTGSGMEFGVGDAYAQERVQIAGRVRTRPLDAWIGLLQKADIPFAPVLTLAEAIDNDHARANGLMRATRVGGRDFSVPASPVRLAAEDERLVAPGPLSSPPGIGEHNDEILRELGLADLAGGATDPS
jgi:crotonobetainyl-CoA:carnitine CoA-transferase CaiB-like acyl-CoA transferase